MKSSVVISRKIQKWKLVDDLKCFKVVMSLILESGSTDRVFRGHKIKKGESIFTLNYLENKFKNTKPQITKRNIRTILKNLEKEKIITRRVIKEKNKSLFTAVSVIDLNLCSVNEVKIDKKESNTKKCIKKIQNDAQNDDILTQQIEEFNSKIATLNLEENQDIQGIYVDGKYLTDTLKEINQTLENKKATHVINALINDLEIKNKRENKQNKLLHSTPGVLKCGKKERILDKNTSSVVTRENFRDKISNEPTHKIGPAKTDKDSSLTSSRNDLPYEKIKKKIKENHTVIKTSDATESIVIYNLCHMKKMEPNQAAAYRTTHDISAFCSKEIHGTIHAICSLVIPYFNRFSPKYRYKIRSNKSEWCILECYYLKNLRDPKDYIAIIDYASTLIIDRYNPNKFSVKNNRALSEYFTLQTIFINKGLEYLSLSAERNETPIVLPKKDDFTERLDQTLKELEEEEKKLQLEKELNYQEGLKLLNKK
jgi:hypothetical protein